MSKVCAVLVGAGTAAWLAAPWIAMARHGTTDQQRTARLATDRVLRWTGPTDLPRPRSGRHRASAGSMARSA